jgi:hypothetical protein
MIQWVHKVSELQAVAVALAARQKVTELLRLTDSERAKLTASTISVAIVFNRLLTIRLVNDGIAMPTRIAATAIVTINSISVKPFTPFIKTPLHYMMALSETKPIHKVSEQIFMIVRYNSPKKPPVVPDKWRFTGDERASGFSGVTEITHS